MHNKKRLRALVVEDNLVAQRYISVFLERVGFEITLIDNGVDALKLLKNNRFDIIFLNVIMPVIDGYAVCKKLKTNPVTKVVPVIMLASKKGVVDKMRGKMSGADVFLVKPIRYVELINAVGKFFPVSKGQLNTGYHNSHDSINRKEGASSELIKKTDTDKKVSVNIRSITDKIRNRRLENLARIKKIANLSEYK